ncbi:MAG TPA: FkbM family methyltransferase [Acidimicrobiales bacterium]
MASTKHARHQARRVWQTPQTFKNWASILADMVGEKVGRGPKTLLFETREGLTIECPNQPGARVPLYEIFAEDCYHFDWFLGPLAGQPLGVLDVGGQIGTFACRLAQIEPKAIVNTYEPSPTSAAVLRRNVDRNKFGDRITVVEEALTSSIGTAELDDNEAGGGQNSLVGIQGNVGTVTVKTTTFDAAVAGAPGPVNVVKIDCEGGEYDLVAASSPESWAPVERLVIEYHQVPGHSWDELRTWFEGVGLSVQLEEPLGPGLGVVWLSREPLARFAA